VELGAAHAEEHRKIGTKAGETVDILLAVAPSRIRDLIDAYKAAKPDGEVVECAGFAQAQSWMGANLQAGDVVLLENDLPDLYERQLKL
jgi:UDP-N-acetylmuramoyl-tripeptide--D-alanyl-D-alanine ligase